MRIEGIIGSVLGTLGGVVGTYFTIKNAHGPRERQFAIRGSLFIWMALGLTVLVGFILPQLRVWSWVPLSVLAVGMVPLWNQRHEMIRREESRK